MFKTISGLISAFLCDLMCKLYWLYQSTENRVSCLEATMPRLEMTGQWSRGVPAAPGNATRRGRRIPKICRISSLAL